MKKMKLILTLLIGITIFSCSNDDDNNNGNTTSDFQGNWSGTFTGDEDNGTWSGTVNENRELSGTVTSDVFSVTWDANGTIQENGNVNITAGTATSGATFVGTFNATTASGTWNNTSASMNGTWSGNKQ